MCFAFLLQSFIWLPMTLPSLSTSLLSLLAVCSSSSALHRVISILILFNEKLQAAFFIFYYEFRLFFPSFLRHRKLKAFNEVFNCRLCLARWVPQGEESESGTINDVDDERAGGGCCCWWWWQLQLRWYPSLLLSLSLLQFDLLHLRMINESVTSCGIHLRHATCKWW